MKKLLFLLTFIIGSALSAQSQVKYDGAFGNGLRFETKDGSFGMKFTTRIQPQFNSTLNLEDNTATNRMRIRRARLKFDGFFIIKDLRYKIEYDVVGGYVRDAVIKYRFAEHFDLWFGQAKLPGNRERIISSANLEMVDRSLFTAFYTIDRDLGVQFHTNSNMGGWIFKSHWAISAGNGIRNNFGSSGLDYTGKLEFLPFGKFTKKGDYIGGDIYREETLKFAFAIGADYNMSAYKSMGQIGLILDSEADLLLFFGDILLKYRGYSLMIEAGTRNTPNSSANVHDPEGEVTGAFYTGFGMNFQTGYVFKKMWEISGRYAFTQPSVDSYSNISDYSAGVGKYIKGHKFKILADFTYRMQDARDDLFIGRLQVEMQF